MTRKGWRWVGCGAIVLGALTGVAANAQEPEMSAEEVAMMAAWTKAMTPGAQHQEMASRAGSWDATVSMWPAAGAPAQVSQGKVVRRMILGGRVLLEEWNGTAMGMPFEGFGTTGYDNASGNWWTTWSDNFGTGVMNGAGNCDADPTKGCTFTSEFVDPITGKEKKNRSTVHWPNPNEERMEMFDTGADGKEWKAMEIVARRKAN